MTFDLGMYIKQQLRDSKSFGVLDYIENREEEIEKLRIEIEEKQSIITEQKLHCEAVDNVNYQLRCCANCEEIKKLNGVMYCKQKEQNKEVDDEVKYDYVCDSWKISKNLCEKE